MTEYDNIYYDCGCTVEYDSERKIWIVSSLCEDHDPTIKPEICGPVNVFCNACGETMNQDIDPESDDLLTCEHCGFTVEDNVKLYIQENILGC